MLYAITAGVSMSEAGLITYDGSECVYRYHPDGQVEKYHNLIKSEHETAARKNNAIVFPEFSKETSE